MRGLQRIFGVVPFTLVFAFAICVAMVGGSFVVARIMSATIAETGRLSQYRVATADVLNSARDAEIGQRGYLLTGERRYLEPYEAGIERLIPAIGNVARIGGPRGKRVAARLKPLVDAKLAELHGTIALYDGGRRDAAIAEVMTDRGKNIMDRMRDIYGVERDYAVGRSETLIARTSRYTTLLSLGLTIGLLALLLAALFWYRQTREQFALLVAARLEAEGSLAALKDEVAARAASEERVRHLQKMQAIGQLTGGIAHDFNNMLAVVMSGIEMALRRLKTRPDEAETFLGASQEAAMRAASLTARLLAFSRNQPLAPRPVDMNALIAGMSDMVTRTLTEAVSVETIRAAGLWRCYADAGEVENAILNLAVNARDAMPDGGKLTIETANAHVDERYAALHGDLKPGQYVLVCVTDTGHGMTPDIIEKAFDPFFTTKDVGQGTGLGLSQVFGFAKQSGGHATIYSEAGQGTTVKLYLPRYEGDAEPTTRTPDMSETPLGKAAEVILVVEDEPRVRELTADMLSELGYTVVATGSPNDAVRIVADRDDLAMVFTDIVMPELNGQKLAEAIRAARPDLPILFTTGYTRNAIVHNQTLDIGVALIAKPYSIRDLALKVRDVLEGRGANRPV